MRPTSRPDKLRNGTAYYISPLLLSRVSSEAKRNPNSQSQKPNFGAKKNGRQVPTQKRQEKEILSQDSPPRQIPRQWYPFVLSLNYYFSFYLHFQFVNCELVPWLRIWSRDDMVYDSLNKADEQTKPLPPDQDLPGMGQFYCLHCE